MPPLDEVGEYLQAQNAGWVVGSTTGTVAIWLGADQDRPGPGVVLYETMGYRPIESLGSSTKSVFERLRLQVVSRSTSYETARNNAELAYATLRAVQNRNLSSTYAASTAYYLRIQPVQPPFSIGRDDQGRLMIAANYQLERVST